MGFPNFPKLALSRLTITRQHAFDPYGNLIARDDFPAFGQTSTPKTRLGHQGLFVENLSTPWSVDLTVVAPPGTEDVIYLNRNRVYQPTLGRFLQRDPNLTGLSINATVLQKGLSSPTPFQQVHIKGAYSGGMNLFSYLDSEPIHRRDAMGLDWWDEVDEVLKGYAKSLFRVTMQLGDAQRGIAKGAKLAAQYAIAAFLWDQFIWDRDEAIGFDLLIGPFFSSMCFESGTMVLMADGTMKLIEDIRVGDRVMMDQSDTEEMEDDVDESTNRDQWQRIRLELEDAEKGLIQISLLRPTFWVAGCGVKAGSRIRIDNTETGIHGFAVVETVEPWDGCSDGIQNGQIVVGTFTTERAPILYLVFEGLDSPIGSTPSHPFYSLDRHAWTSAADLSPGEIVQTLAGSTVFAGFAEGGHEGTVYNIDVQRDHTYYVSSEHILVHNPCSADAIGMADGYHSSMGDPGEWKFLRTKDIDKGRKTPWVKHVYEVWEDAWGVIREVHYWLPDKGDIYGVVIKEYSP